MKKIFFNLMFSQVFFISFLLWYVIATQKQTLRGARKMVETLEIGLPKNKILKILLVESEDNGDWLDCQGSRTLAFSKTYADFVLSIIDCKKPSFVSIEVCSGTYDNFESDVLSESLRSRDIPSILSAIPAEALSYLDSETSPIKETLVRIRSEITRIALEEPEESRDEDLMNLEAWGGLLEEQIEEQESSLEGSIRNSWIVKQIFDQASKVSGRTVTILHICDESRFSELSDIFSQFGVETENICFREKLKFRYETVLPLAENQ